MSNTIVAKTTKNHKWVLNIIASSKAFVINFKIGFPISCGLDFRREHTKMVPLDFSLIYVLVLFTGFVSVGLTKFQDFSRTRWTSFSMII